MDISCLAVFLQKHFACALDDQAQSAFKLQFVQAGAIIGRVGTDACRALVLYEGAVFAAIPKSKGLYAEGEQPIHKVCCFQPGDVLNRIEMRYHYHFCRFKCPLLLSLYAQTAVTLVTVEPAFYSKFLKGNKENQNWLQPLLQNFVQLPKRYLYLLESNSLLITHNKGTKLFRAGDAATKLYYLLEGDVDIYMPYPEEAAVPFNSPSFSRKQIRSKKVLILSAGEFFGFESEDTYAYEARVASVDARLLAVDSALLKYICECCETSLAVLSTTKLRLMGTLLVPCKMPPLKDSPCLKPPKPKTDFKEEVLSDKNADSVLYTQSLKSSSKAARCGRVRFSEAPQQKLTTNLYEFNCMKYGTSLRKKKFLELLKLLRLRQQQVGNTPQISEARKAIRRCQLSPCEILQIQNDLTGGMPNKSYFTKMADKNRVKIITTRKAYTQLQSESLSSLKIQRLRTEIDSRTLLLRTKRASFDNS